jgi:hypothetical protein
MFTNYESSEKQYKIGRQDGIDDVIARGIELVHAKTIKNEGFTAKQLIDILAKEFPLDGETTEETKD